MLVEAGLTRVLAKPIFKTLIKQYPPGNAWKLMSKDKWPELIPLAKM